MWKFIRKYLHYAVIGALLMVGEVFMDLLQPGIMRIIVVRQRRQQSETYYQLRDLDDPDCTVRRPVRLPEHCVCEYGGPRDRQ